MRGDVDENVKVIDLVRTCIKQSAYVHSHHSISATHQYGISDCKQSAATIDANNGEVVRELDITEGVVGGIEHANAMLGAIYQLFAHIGKGIAEVAHNVAVVGVEHLKRMFLLVEAVYSAAYRRYIDATIAVLADISEFPLRPILPCLPHKSAAHGATAPKSCTVPTRLPPTPCHDGQCRWHWDGYPPLKQ